MESVMALRAGGHDSEIHLFTDSTFPPLNPTLLTYFIAGKIGVDGLFPFGGDFASIGDISQGGDISCGDDVFEMESRGKYCRINWKDGRIMGINLLNMPEISGILKSHVQKSQEFSTIAMCKVFDKSPPVREAFLKRGAW